MTVQQQSKGDPFDFILGQDACKRGVPCPEGATEYFERGYNAQYQLEEVNSKEAERGQRQISAIA